MARFGFNFGGRRRVLPGAYSTLDRTPRPGAATGLSRVVAVIGESLGGEPGVVIRLGGPGDAITQLIGGDLLHAIDLVYQPSPDTNGPAEVVAIRVNPATQSDADINATGPVKVATITSLQYGSLTAGLRFKVEDGTDIATYAGIKKVTIEDTLNNPGKYKIHDDLGKGLMLQYVGAGSAATITVTHTTGRATALATTVTGGPGGQNLSIDLTSKLYDTYGKIAAYIEENYSGVYTVALAGAGGTESGDLDPIAGVDVKTAVYHVRGILSGVINDVTADSLLVEITREGTAVLPPLNVAWTMLTGGVEGTTSNADWEAALDALMAEPDVRYVVPVTTDLSVIADVVAHVLSAEIDEMIPRQAFVGIADEADAAATLTALVSAVGQIGCSRLSLCAPGVVVRTLDGLETFDGWANAAAQCGIKAGLPVGASVTYKRINVPAVSLKFTRSQQEALIQAGVSLVQTKPGQGQKVIRSLTTEQTETDYLFTAPEAIEGGDEILGRIREKAESSIGKPGDRGQAAALKEVAISELRAAEREGLLASGIDETGQKMPAFRNVSVTLERGVGIVEFECSVAGTLYYIGVKGHVVTVGQSV